MLQRSYDLMTYAKLVYHIKYACIDCSNPYILSATHNIYAHTGIQYCLSLRAMYYKNIYYCIAGRRYGDISVFHGYSYVLLFDHVQIMRQKNRFTSHYIYHIKLYRIQEMCTVKLI